MHRHRAFAPAAIVAFALALRIAACAATAPTPLVNDELDYHRLGLEWKRSGELSERRAPLTAVVYGSAQRWLGESPGAARAANSLLGTGLVALVWVLAVRVGNRRSALVAAALAAAYPTLIGFSHSLWADTLYLVLALLALERVLAIRSRLTIARCAAAGVALGLAALTREVGLALIPALAAVVWWQARKQGDDKGGKWSALGAAAALVICAGCVVAPWSLHLSGRAGRPVLVTATSGMNLYLGNPRPGSFTSIPAYVALGDDFFGRDAAAQRIALAAIRERMPAWPFEKLSELRDLFAPTSFIVKRLLDGADPQERNPNRVGQWRYRFAWPLLEAEWIRLAIASLAIAAYVTIALSGAAGLALRAPPSVLLAFGAFALAHVLPTLVTFASTRFRLPLLPLLFIGSAYLWEGGRSGWAEASGGRRRAALASVLAAFGLLVWGASSLLPAALR